MGWKGRGIFVVASALILLFLYKIYIMRESESFRLNGDPVLIIAAAAGFALLVWIVVRAGFRYDKAVNFFKQRDNPIRIIREWGRMEKELLESKERYRGLLEQMLDGVIVVSEGRIVYLNSAGARLLGAGEPRQLIGTPLFKLIHPDDLEALYQPIQTEASTVKPKELRLLRQDGTSIEAELKIHSIVYDGKIALQMIVRDQTELKRSGRELIAAQQELRDVLRYQQGVTFKFVRKGNDFIHTLWEGELAYEMGLPPDQVIGRSLKVLFADETVERMLPYYQRAWEEGRVSIYEAELMRTPCLVTLRPIIRDGEVKEVVGYFTDITLRKQTEEELHRAKEILESFFTNTTDAIDVHDLDGYILHINRAYEEMYGWSAEETVGRPLLSIVPPHLHDEVNRLHEAVSSGEHITGYETKRLRKNGEQFDVSITISPVWDDEGEIIAMATISRDITESKRVVRALRKSEAKYRLIADNMTDVISVLNYLGIVEYMSPSCKTMLGLEPDKLVGTSIFEWMHPEDKELIGAFYNQTLKASPGEIVELRLRHADGHWVMLEASSRWIPDLDNGSMPNILVVARDITERKQAEEMLRKSEKLSVVGQLAAGVAHEIRNPLTSLKGFLQLLQKRTAGNDFFFEVMLSELERINAIVNEFLVLSKPQTAKFERRDVAQIVLNVVSFLESQAIMSNVEMLTDIQSDSSIDVDCDENQLKQVFINFLKNAVEAMPDGGRITVTVKRTEAGKVLIRFADQGVGIPEDRLPKLGEPFYTTKEKGTGLGLMVSFRIIEEHRGAIRVQSEVGAGTTFDVELPVPEEELWEGPSD